MARILYCNHLQKHRAMTKITFKTIATAVASVTLVLTIVLCVHIYIVTRPGKAAEEPRVMARIDFKQDISQEDADKIAAWLYAQKGVDHVLCNAGSNIAVFTFSPKLNDANVIVADLKSATSYKAERFMPSEQEMMAGCPVAAGSITSRVYNFFKSI